MNNKKDDKLFEIAVKILKIPFCIKYGICIVPPSSNSQLMQQRINKANYSPNCY